MLAQKVSGTCAGVWLLVPELLRLGVWDLLKGWTRGSDIDFEPRIALQLINESALCINRVRKKNSLNHQGFQLANGMGRLITDEQVHLVLNNHKMEEAQELLVNLGYQRQLCGHYKGDIVAIDPHRMISASKRVMAKKKKVADSPSEKMLQTYFSLCTRTGQPIMVRMASTGMPTTIATKQLLLDTERILKKKTLLIADKEHFTIDLLTWVKQHYGFDILVPVLMTEKIKMLIKTLTYTPLWPGYAIAETCFCFNGSKEVFRLIAQRSGEIITQYSYNAFITTSRKSAQQLLTEIYDQRWNIEEFFRFENELGMNRASTLNLNIRYGKLALSMIAQAATHQLRRKLKNDYQKWDAKHLATEVLAWADGDIRVKDDTIIVTFYHAPKHINPSDYMHLPRILEKENIDPRIPWLYDFKLDFQFK
ncbi:MAG: transposase [Cyclobacteriaceae bacterium]|nr:transposase [Cyclobacteriaceae bacterium]